MGFCLLQGYGQTEASPLISCNTKLNNNPKTVGLPIKNVSIKFSKDNEILVKGKNVMIGYWNNSQLTKKTIKNGWLHTGDLGFLDNKGRIIINGRKKDLIVTSGGDNISTQKIENLLLNHNEIQQVLIYGDNKPYLVALIVPSEKTTLAQIKELISKVNTRLNSIEKVRKILLIEEPFNYENGFLTQTQKIKKNKVFDFYKERIKNLY